MFSKAQFLQSVEQETKICKHLYEKIPHGAMSYRPTERQRSMLELLQYLTVCATIPTQGLIRNDWGHIQEILTRVRDLPAGDFSKAMDKQVQEIKEMIEPLTEKDLVEKDTSMPLGTSCKLGEGLINFTLKFLTAYRMQLFLYLKAVGVDDISTYNCWAGMDKPS